MTNVGLVKKSFAEIEKVLEIYTKVFGAKNPKTVESVFFSFGFLKGTFSNLMDLVESQKGKDVENGKHKRK